MNARTIIKYVIAAVIGFLIAYGIILVYGLRQTGN
jgi:hypothetical protein